MAIATRMQHTVMMLGWPTALLYWLAQAISRTSGGRWQLYAYRYVAQQVGQQVTLGTLLDARGGDITIASMAAGAPLPAGYPRGESVVAARHAQGARSLAAWRRGRLAGFLWLIEGGYDEDEVRARFELPASDACWDFDVWVHPDERLGFVFVRLWEAAQQVLCRRGVHWSCSRISAFNAASRRAHAAMGARPLGSALFLRCGSWQWMVATIPPQLHLSRRANRRPVIRLDTSKLITTPTIDEETG